MDGQGDLHRLPVRQVHSSSPQPLPGQILVPGADRGVQQQESGQVIGQFRMRCHGSRVGADSMAEPTNH